MEIGPSYHRIGLLMVVILSSIEQKHVDCAVSLSMILGDLSSLMASDVVR